MITVSTYTLLLRTSATVPGQNIAITLPQGDVVTLHDASLGLNRPSDRMVTGDTVMLPTELYIWRDFLKGPRIEPWLAQRWRPNKFHFQRV